MGKTEDLRVVWMADIFDELSGVVTDSIEMNAMAAKNRIPWYPITCYPQKIEPFHNFKQLFKVSAGRVYKGSYIYLPDFTEVILYLRKLGTNVIISNTPASMGLTAMAAARYLGIPWVDIYHTDVDYYLNILSRWYLKPLLRPAMWYVKQYHKRADLIFVRTQEYFDLMVSKGHPKEKIRYYRAGVNTEHFHPRYKDRSLWEAHGVDAGKIIVLFVGRITMVKDITFLLDYFQQTNPQNAELVMVGHGPELADYQKKYGKHPSVHFLGKRTGLELQKIYASSDLYVLPSASETLGKTVLESMSSGLPVLVSDKGGPKDYVREGVSGRIFRAADTSDFGEKLTSLLSDKNALPAMGEKARETVLPYTDEKLFADFAGNIATLI